MTEQTQETTPPVLQEVTPEYIEEKTKQFNETKAKYAESIEKAKAEEIEQMKNFLEKLEDLDTMNEDELRDIVRNVVCPDANNSNNYSTDMKQLLGRLHNLEAKIELETVPVYDMVMVSFLNSIRQISYNNMKVFSQLLLEETSGKNLSVHEMADTLLKITNTLLENKTKWFTQW